MTICFQVSIQPVSAEPAKILPQKQIVVISDSVENCVAKVRAAYEGCDIKAVRNVFNVDLP